MPQQISTIYSLYSFPLPQLQSDLSLPIPSLQIKACFGFSLENLQIERRINNASPYVTCATHTS
ncbi:hypothetical protein RSAG8_08307, partial [Rhizoctonia solani AG-8 WAC10335]